MKVKVLGLAAVAAAVLAIPAIAHHSFAMFDAEKVATLEGTVKEFQWTNPHSWILMMPDTIRAPSVWSRNGLFSRGLKC